MRHEKKSVPGFENAARAAFGLVLATMLATLMGCYDYTLPASQVVVREHIYAMRDDTDKILRTGCKVVAAEASPRAFAWLQCRVTLSTAVSDLLNDIHTMDRLGCPAVAASYGFFVGPAVLAFCNQKRSEVKGELIGRAISACNKHVNKALDQAIGGIEDPTIRWFAGAYRPQANVWLYCVAAVSGLWSETDKDRYSTGGRCARVDLHLFADSFDKPPGFAMTMGPGDVGDTALAGCEGERTSPAWGIYWGNG